MGIHSVFLARRGVPDIPDPCLRSGSLVLFLSRGSQQTGLERAGRPASGRRGAVRGLPGGSPQGVWRCAAVGGEPLLLVLLPRGLARPQPHGLPPVWPAPGLIHPHLVVG